VPAGSMFTPKMTLCSYHKEHGERQKQFHHGSLQIQTLFAKRISQKL
jgi:hypothetical protein